MWVKVDDKIKSHPKFLAAAAELAGGATVRSRKGKRSLGRVLGFWVEAATDAAGYLTGGFISDVSLEAFIADDDPRRVFEAFCKHGLADRDDERGGFVLHDFEHYQGDASERKDHQTFQVKYRRLLKARDLLSSARVRDAVRCRYCGRLVNFDDRVSNSGGSYDLIDPAADVALLNVVVCCQECGRKKHGRTLDEAAMVLLPAASSGVRGQVVNQLQLPGASAHPTPASDVIDADFASESDSNSDSGSNSASNSKSDSVSNSALDTRPRARAGTTAGTGARGRIPSRPVQITINTEEPRAQERRARALRMLFTHRTTVQAVKTNLRAAVHFLVELEGHRYRDHATGAWLTGQIVERMKDVAKALDADWRDSSELVEIVESVLATRQRRHQRAQRRRA